MRDDQRDYIIMCIAGFLTNVAMGLSFSMTPLYASVFTTSLFLIGFAVSGYFVVRMFSEIPWGLLSDRIGRKKPIAIGVIFEMIGAVLGGSASSVYQIILGRVFWGVGSAAYFCVGTSAIADLFPREKRGSALGTFQGIQSLGMASGAFLSGYVVLSMGYGNLFYACAAIFLITFVLFLTLKLKPAASESKTDPTSIKIRDVWRIFINPVMILVSVMIFSLMIQNSGLMNSTFPLYLKFDLKMSVIDIGSLSALVTVGTAFGNIVGGWLSDRIGRLKVLGSAFVFGATGLFLIPFAYSFWTLVPLAGLAGMCFGFVYSVAPTLVSENFSSSIRGAAIGVYRTSFDIGGFLGPFVTATIATFLGNKMAFYFVSGLLALNILVAFSMRKIKGAR